MAYVVIGLFIITVIIVRVLHAPLPIRALK